VLFPVVPLPVPVPLPLPFPIILTRSNPNVLLGIQILILPGVSHNGPVTLAGQLHTNVSGKTSTQVLPALHGLLAQFGTLVWIAASFQEKYDINTDSFSIFKSYVILDIEFQ
jgi:hypothetical protein